MAYEDYKPREMELRMATVIEKQQAEIERLKKDNEECMRVNAELAKYLGVENLRLRALAEQLWHEGYDDLSDETKLKADQMLKVEGGVRVRLNEQSTQRGNYEDRHYADDSPLNEQSTPEPNGASRYRDRD